MISIPSSPAAAAVPTKTSQQPSAATPVSNDDSTSFASHLRSLQGQQSGEEETNGKPAPTLPKLSLGGKDKSGKDTKKNDDDKKNSSLLTDTNPVPLPPATLPEPKSFQLAWSQAKSEIKSDQHNSSQSSASADSDPKQEADTAQGLSTAGLKSNVADAVTNAPVAFGANLSKTDFLRADGLQSDGLKSDALKATEGKAEDTKPAEVRPKTSSAEGASAKPVTGEVPKPSETRNSSSGNQQQSGSPSRDDQPAPGGTQKAAGSSGAHTAAENPATLHATAAAASSDQTQASVATVQNAYAPAHTGSLAKSAPVAPTTAAAEPAQTPSIRPQNIDLKIAGADNSQVDVRISQRAGDVQVTVRTPDGDLAQSLRQHLPELSDRLSQAGVSGDLWQPQTAQAANTGGNDTDSRYSDDAQTQQQGQQQQHSRNGSHNGQQQESDTPPPAWLNELNQANKESR